MVEHTLNFEPLLTPLASEAERAKQRHSAMERISALNILEGIYGVSAYYRKQIMGGDMDLTSFVSSLDEGPHWEAKDVVGLVVVAESRENRYLHEVTEAAGCMIAEWEQRQADQSIDNSTQTAA